MVQRQLGKQGAQGNIGAEGFCGESVVVGSWLCEGILGGKGLGEREGDGNCQMGCTMSRVQMKPKAGKVIGTYLLARCCSTSSRPSIARAPRSCTGSACEASPPDRHTPGRPRSTTAASPTGAGRTGCRCPSTLSVALGTAVGPPSQTSALDSGHRTGPRSCHTESPSGSRRTGSGQSS